MARSTVQTAQAHNRAAVKAFRQLAHKLAKKHGMHRDVAEPLVSKLLAEHDEVHGNELATQDELREPLRRYMAKLQDFSGQAAAAIRRDTTALRMATSYLRDLDSERNRKPGGKRRLNTIPHEATSLSDYNF